MIQWLKARSTHQFSVAFLGQVFYTSNLLKTLVGFILYNSEYDYLWQAPNHVSLERLSVCDPCSGQGCPYYSRNSYTIPYLIFLTDVYSLAPQ